MATKTTSIILSYTGIGLIVLPTANGISCASALSNEKLCAIKTKNYNKYRKQIETAEQNEKASDKLYKQCL